MREGLDHESEKARSTVSSQGTCRRMDPLTERRGGLRNNTSVSILPEHDRRTPPRKGRTMIHYCMLHGGAIFWRFVLGY